MQDGWMQTEDYSFDSLAKKMGRICDKAMSAQASAGNSIVQLQIYRNDSDRSLTLAMPQYPIMNEKVTVTDDGWLFHGNVYRSDYMYNNAFNLFKYAQYSSLRLLNILNIDEIKRNCTLELTDPLNFVITNNQRRKMHFNIDTNANIIEQKFSVHVNTNDRIFYKETKPKKMEASIRDFAGVLSNPKHKPVSLRAIWPAIGRLADIIEHLSIHGPKSV